MQEKDLQILSCRDLKAEATPIPVQAWRVEAVI